MSKGKAHEIRTCSGGHGDRHGDCGSQSLKLQSPGVGAEWAPCQPGEGTQGPRGLEGFAEVDPNIIESVCDTPGTAIK